MEARPKALDSKRIEWIDLYKGIAILLVVIGHTTGMFNAYIYQFHMAAFLFISGYTTNLSKRSFTQTLYAKTRTLLLPFFTIFLLLLCLVEILHRMELYPLFFEETHVYIVPSQALLNLFCEGNNYIYWMGAAWFLTVLFGVVVVQKLIEMIFKTKTLCGVVSFALFLGGYALVHSGRSFQISLFSFDLIFIAQFYFYCGMLARERKYVERWLTCPTALGAGLFASIIVLYYFAHINPVKVDYPSRYFGFFLTDALAALNGIAFVAFLSIALFRLSFSQIKRPLEYIGKKTLGILFFHFAAFKVAFFVLYLLGAMPLSDLKYFVPPPETGAKYWPLLVVVSVAISILVWNALCLIKPLAILLGEQPTSRRQANTIKPKFFTSRGWIHQLLGRVWARFKPLCCRLNMFVWSICLLCLLPLINTGVTVNDELQYRFVRMEGFIPLLLHRIRAELNQGRPMRLLSAINQSVGFLSRSNIMNGVVRIAVTFLCLLLLQLFLEKLNGNSSFSAFITIATAVFLPITFEHAAPMAFTGLMALTMIYQLSSLIFLLKYFDGEKKSFLIASSAFFLASLLSYEFMITFVLLYPLLALVRTKSFKRTVVISLPFAGLAVLYMAGLLLSMLLSADSGYSGTQIGFVSMSSSFDILKNLFLSSLPGFYLINPVYRGLTLHYHDRVYAIDWIRMGAVAVTVLLAVQSLNPAANKAKRILPYFATGVVALLYSVIPSLPNAIVALYQGNVGPGGFIALPVSFFLHFAIVLALGSFLWSLVEIIGGKIRFVILSTALLIGLAQQYQNSLFANTHADTYQRLRSIERVLASDTIRTLDGQEILASDLYITQNSLGFQDDYWTQYAQSRVGIDVALLKEKSPTNDNLLLTYPDSQLFILRNADEVTVLSETPLEMEEWKSLLTLDRQDNGFYLYKGTVDLLPQADNLGFVSGQYYDGWVRKRFQTVIKTGPKGQLTISGYYPYELNGLQTGKVSFGQEEYFFLIEENNFTFSYSAVPNEIFVLTIENDFQIESDSDERELCFILVGIETG